MPEQAMAPIKRGQCPWLVSPFGPHGPGRSPDNTLCSASLNHGPCFGFPVCLDALTLEVPQMCLVPLPCRFRPEQAAFHLFRTKAVPPARVTYLRRLFLFPPPFYFFPVTQKTLSLQRPEPIRARGPTHTFSHSRTRATTTKKTSAHPPDGLGWTWRVCVRVCAWKLTWD
ncbi:hypothetical protein LY76DRAFT_189115 [Colletotrichum caudatum]|nr:hypothetical protein LY76DRAFT_189115 [Colletotrichum caudatum]